MGIIRLVQQMEAINGSGVLLKPEDKEFLHQLDITLNGVNTVMIDINTFMRVARIHQEVFKLCQDEGCPQSSIEHICVN